jgi:hypothetical protein
MAHVGYTSRLTLIALIFIATFSSTPVIAEDDDATLLNVFHKKGITKCDSFILEHGKLKGNWHIVTTTHPSLNNDSFKELGLTQVTGTQGDSLKSTQSYIQTSTACYVTEISTVTFSGNCSDRDNIDPEYWYLKDEMKGLDYKKYENKGGITLFAKEISVGNFTACVIEYHTRNQTKFGK